MSKPSPRFASRALPAWIACILALLLSACAQTAGLENAGPTFAPMHYYPPPGPADDPWGPYIQEAADRYQIPAQWIRAVMAQESAGEEQAISPAGAIGLMQVMPDTYEELREENNLRDDPFNPHDNILAGAAYIKEMYDRYGSPGFLAAYNAGPSDVDAYIAGQAPLPDETVNYLAAVTPNLGDEIPFSGPLANYQSGAAGAAPTAAGFATGCDVNLAYDPANPCTAAPRAEADNLAQSAANSGCVADAAYDPDNPCTPTPASAAPPPAPTPAGCDLDAAYVPGQPCQPAPAPPAAQPGWSIQVGAYASPSLARAVAEGARQEALDTLQAAAINTPATAPFGGAVLYQARLTNLSAAQALSACSSLNRHQLPCVVVPEPGA